MGWKIYPLGTQKKVQYVATNAAAQLISLGYNASGTGSDYAGDLSVVIDGTSYVIPLNSSNGLNGPSYLCFNDETKSIVVCAYNGTYKDTWFTDTLLGALYHGKNVDTGETGLFPSKSVTGGGDQITNLWVPVDGANIIFLHRAVFRKNSYSDYNLVTSDLYWGSVCHTTGAVIAVGTDSFVCLNHCLYAKL